MRKTENGTVTQSEESITRITSYRPLSFSTFSWQLTANGSQLTADSFYLLTAFLITGTDPSLSLQDDAFRSPSLWRFPFPITSDALSFNRHSERRQKCCSRKTGNGIVTRSEESITLNDILPFSSPRQQILHIRFGWRLNVLYKDHGAGRQKELPAHVVRLMIPACRNDLIVKEYLACSWQLTADSFYLLTIFLTTAANPSPLISKAMSKQRLLFSVFCLWPTADGCQLTAISHHSLSERLGLFIKIAAKGIQFLYFSMYNKVQTEGSADHLYWCSFYLPVRKTAES